MSHHLGKVRDCFSEDEVNRYWFRGAMHAGAASRFGSDPLLGSRVKKMSCRMGGLSANRSACVCLPDGMALGTGCLVSATEPSKSLFETGCPKLQNQDIWNVCDQYSQAYMTVAQDISRKMDEIVVVFM